MGERTTACGRWMATLAAAALWAVGSGCAAAQGPAAASGGEAAGAAGGAGGTGGAAAGPTRAERAAAVKLRAVGNAAPGLAGGEWARGSGFDAAELGRARGVVVWSGECGPCLASMQVMDAATARWPVVTVMWSDRAGDTAARRALVAGMDLRLRLRVLVDDEANSVGRPWLTEVAGEVGWPTAFVLDAHGRLAWVGHPMGELSEVLEWVDGPAYSPEAARARMEAQVAEEARARPLWTEFWEVAAKGTPEALEGAAERLRGVGPDAAMGSWLRLVQVYVQRGDAERALGAARRFEAVRAEMGSGLAKTLGWRVWATAASVGLEGPDGGAGGRTAAAVACRGGARAHLERELAAGFEHPGVLTMLAWCKADAGDAAGVRALLDRAAVFDVTAAQRAKSAKQRAAMLEWAGQRGAEGIRPPADR
ncbi:MAG: TlpA family protein disulfide reductase [bacterium]